MLLKIFSPIHTARCELRSLERHDLHHVIALYRDEAVRRFLGGIVDEKEIEKRFDSMVASNDLNWAVERMDDHTFLGLINLDAHHDGTDTEVSYQFLPSSCGKGYATETVGAVIHYGLQKLDLPRIVAETQAANLTSCRLLERLGLRIDRRVERFGAQQIIYATSVSEAAGHNQSPQGIVTRCDTSVVLE